LFGAVSDNDLLFAEWMLNAGVDPNLADEDGTTVLELAEGEELKEMATLLKAFGAGAAPKKLRVPCRHCHTMNDPENEKVCAGCGKATETEAERKQKLEELANQPARAPWSEVDTNSCLLCRDAIVGSFVPLTPDKARKGHPNCVKCVLCSEALIGKPFAMSEPHNGLLCSKCYQMANAPSCMGCNEPILEAFLNVLDGKWHQQCFLCAESTCRTSLTVIPYFTFDKKPYCEEHFTAINQAACDRCEKPIKGAYFTDFGKKWHATCFYCEDAKEGGPDHLIKSGDQYHFYEDKVFCRRHFSYMFETLCDVCNKAITGGFYSVNGKPVHHACASGKGHMILLTADGKAATYYSYDVLVTPALLPPDVDARFKESFLNDMDFLKMFRMTKQAFATLPTWKKKALKAEVGLA
jgi:hypothetical protein